MYFLHLRRELHYLIPQKKGMLFMIATLIPNNATYTLGLYSTPSLWLHILVGSILFWSVLLVLLSKVVYDVNTCVHILGTEPHTHHFIMAGMSQLRHKCSQMLCELRRLKDKGGARVESPLRFLMQKLNPLGTGLVSFIFEIWPVSFLATSH